jgi:hypothetical protein
MIDGKDHSLDGCAMSRDHFAGEIFKTRVVIIGAQAARAPGLLVAGDNCSFIVDGDDTEPRLAGSS